MSLRKSFNSKMVWLKEIGGKMNILFEYKFQFQNGLIKSAKIYSSLTNNIEFQFQNGLIKSPVNPKW